MEQLKAVAFKGYYSQGSNGMAGSLDEALGFLVKRVKAMFMEAGRDDVHVCGNTCPARIRYGKKCPRTHRLEMIAAEAGFFARDVWAIRYLQLPTQDLSFVFVVGSVQHISELQHTLSQPYMWFCEM